MTCKQFKFYVQANWIKTIYFNFKTLPFFQAIRCPILLFGPCDVQCGKNAKVIFENQQVSFASMFIGNSQASMWMQNQRNEHTFIAINGEIHLRGSKQFIGNGCKIVVADRAKLFLGDHILLNNMVKLACYNKIIIEDLTSVSWECQIFDTNFHYILDEQGHTKRNSGIIHIGANCWVGYRTTIQKNTILSDYTTIASNSLVNKDFSSIKYGTFAGVPAKLVATGKTRLLDYPLEYALNDFFAQHPEVEEVAVNKNTAHKFNDYNDLDITPTK